MSREEIKDRLLAARGTTEDLLAQIHELYVQDIRSEKKLPVPQEDWAVTRGTHLPLVSQETFDAAALNLGKGTRNYQKYDHVRKSIFSGIAVCEKIACFQYAITFLKYLSKESHNFVCGIQCTMKQTNTRTEL